LAEPDQNEPEEPEREAAADAVSDTTRSEELEVVCDTTRSEGELFPDTAETPKRVKPENLTADFENWWLQYPRKVSKGAAAKAYARARKSATADELELGAMRYAAVRSREDPTYTKHPSTWLNNKCWLDEPEPARGSFGERPARARSTGAAPAQSWTEIALEGLRDEQLD
jgi:hypothetical protein